MKVQPKKIMCAVDFSDFTNECLVYSIALCRQFHSKLFLVHIVTDVSSSFVYSQITTDRLKFQEEQIASAQELLGDLAKKVTVEHEIVIHKGDPAYEIRRLALKEKIDMVVTATHGTSGMQRLLIGSVTEKLIKTLPCPLLMLCPQEHGFKPLHDGEMKLKKILVGCDFSPDSKLAFDYGLSLAQEFQAELHLAHVVKPTEYIELKSSDYLSVIPGDYDHWRILDYIEIQKKVTEENREKINQIRSRLERQLYLMFPEEGKTWCPPHTILLDGEPYKELIKYAKEQEFDMVILGIRGHTLWEKLMVGSTTDRVIRHAPPCPVLAVRPVDEHNE
ncbi:MAG: universal stress protein [Desulforhopalus sp.]|nr:universal stress protein [Desulforhopalus sp.]